MSRTQYDLIVVGGGINGAGIAREAASRGLRTLLVEKNDFGSGTSSWSSRLIHGGLRYLEYAEIPLVYESLHERRTLLKTAAHLIAPIRIVIPIFKDSRRGKGIVRLGMLAYDLLSVGKALPRHDMLGRRELIAAMPAMRTEGLTGAAAYFDAQVQYAERLVMENILAAEACGATVRNYCAVEEITHANCCVTGVRCRDARLGTTETVTAPLVVNAGGPWVDRVLGALPQTSLPRFIGGTKGSHIVVPRFDGFPDNAIYVEAAKDGRPIFIIPWNRQLLIGTTDMRIDIDPAHVTASLDEVDYLIGEVNRVFPRADLNRASVSYTYAGVRPLPHQGDGPESAITRKHVIRHHRETARGLYSIIGGKLTTFRSLAEDTVDRLGKDFDLELARSSTARTLFPGAEDLDDVRRELETGAWRTTASTGAHLLDTYGGRARAVLALAQSNPELSEVVCDWSGAIAAEIVFALRYEHACTLEDVMNRRTMTGLGPDKGLNALGATARVVAAELDWSPATEAAAVNEYRNDLRKRFHVIE